MKTIRSLMEYISDYIDFDTSHYISSSVTLPMKENKEYHFSTMNDWDMRTELYIGLGQTLSRFKKGHIHTVHVCLPREFVTPEIEKYRDDRDPAMYKFWLPERIFNSILHDHPVDADKARESAFHHYLEFGNHWDSDDVYAEKVSRMPGWEKYFYPSSLMYQLIKSKEMKFA